MPGHIFAYICEYRKSVQSVTKPANRKPRIRSNLSIPTNILNVLITHEVNPPKIYGSERTGNTMFPVLCFLYGNT